jgi:MFS family permease
MMAGVVAVALLSPGRSPTALVWVLVVGLLVAGLGGGGVISPNFTLTLAEVPPSMGGAAGAVLQTGQRIGSAFGAALLVTVYEVAAGPLPADRALQVTLLTSLLVLSTALLTAVLARGSERQRIAPGA